MSNNILINKESLKHLTKTYFCSNCNVHNRTKECVFCKSKDLEKFEWGFCKNCDDLRIKSNEEEKIDFCSECGESLVN